VGVAIKRWVSFHGFSLNYETDLKYFELINPCGLEGKKTTTMAKVLETKISRERLIEKLSFHFNEIFERDWKEKNLEELMVD
jgi:lipoate-protein ligase B